MIAAGIADERSMAEVASGATRDTDAQVKGDVDALLAEDYVREPLRRHDVPPDHRRRRRDGARHR